MVEIVADPRGLMFGETDVLINDAGFGACRR